MFQPKYQITELLLANIKRAAELGNELRHKRLTGPVRAELVRRAVTLSAHCSTSIEGNPLPLTEVRQLLKLRPKNLRDSEREVVNYNDALEHLNALMAKGQGRLDRKRLLAIHRAVLQGLEPPELCGHFRAQPVVVNDPRSGQVVYLPPDHAEVPGLVDGLLEFVSRGRREVDPLILAGVFHRQLVLIHPFADGNGRTTRLATKLLLAELGLDTFPLFSFENYYNRDVTRYFAKVGLRGDYYELRDPLDFTPWLEYFTAGLVDELQRVLGQCEAMEPAPGVRLEPHHLAILKYLEQHGLIADRDYATLTSRAKATRALDFRHLLALGLLERHGQGRATHYRLAVK